MLDMQQDPNPNHSFTLPHQPTHPPTFTSNGAIHPSVGIGSDAMAPSISSFPQPFFPEDYEDIITSSTTTCALCGQIGHFAYECQHLSAMIGQIPRDVSNTVTHPIENHRRRTSITPYQGTRRFVFIKYRMLLP